MNLFKKISAWIKDHELICSIIGIIIIALLTFLPSVKDCGFYADDYHAVYGAYTYGPEKIVITAWIDRPGAGFTLQWLYLLFGPQIHYYQALVILLDIATALSILWIIRRVWPGQKTLAFMIAAMAVIYPGFNEFMESYNFSLMLMSVSFYIFSIGLTVKVIYTKKPIIRICLSVLAALLSLWSVLLNEYYLGLEVLRLGLIWLIQEDLAGASVQKYKVMLKTLERYIPYLFTMGGFFIWRFFFFSNQRNATDLGHFVNLLVGSPIYKILTILSGLFNNLLNITLYAWFEPAYRYLNNLRLKDFLFCGAIALIGSVFFFLLYKNYRNHETDSGMEKKTMLQFVLLGLITVIGTSLPIVFVNREVTFMEYSKYSLSGMIGGIMILAALIHYYIKPGIRPFVVAFLIFSGIISQLGIGKSLESEWTAAKDMWWQLSWRAPSIKPGTVLTGLNSKYRLEEGFNIWAPANMIYYPTAKNPVIMAETINSDFIQAIQMGKDPVRNFRTYILASETDKTLVMSVPSDVSCLHLINGAAPNYSSYDSISIQFMGQYSKIDQVDVNAEPASPPTVFFGEEPAHGWCYYYQKADLAAQKGDFSEVITLRDQAEQQGLHPNDQVEWLPFILAYAEKDDQEALQQLLPMFLDKAFHKVNYCANLNARNYNISEQAHQLLFSMTCSE